ncbi:hypothetical protein H2136_20820 [Aeromonas hydrophila]|uniref:Uncharacterized protein n=1 Tax=Aeromonas hydrophila TaxID=644 RepID=A0A926FMG2_AERHY|nr:hypothetical protein [Aeromonas hydrophila]
MNSVGFNLIEGRARCSAANARGALSAGDVAELGSPVGRCWAVSPGWTADWGHHLVGYPVRRPGSLGGDRRQERAAVLQPLEAPRWPAAPASPWWCEIRSGGRAAGPWPSPRAGRQTGPSPGGLPSPGPGSQGRVIANRNALQCCNRSRHPAGQQPQLLPGGARSDPVGVLLNHGQVPGRDGRQGHHLAGYPVRRPGSQGQVIAGRSDLQCCNRSRCSVGRRRCRAGVTGGALLGHGHVPGGTADRAITWWATRPAAWP